MTTPAPTAERALADIENEGQERQANEAATPVGQDQPPSADTAIMNNSNTDDHANNHGDTLPGYSRIPEARYSCPPPYRTSTRPLSMMTEQERLASLEEFIESKMYANDLFGGHKGQPFGPPNDPTKPFRWIMRKFRGEKGVWKKLTDDQRRKWEAEGGPVNETGGELVIGDVDTSRII